MIDLFLNLIICFLGFYLCARFEKSKIFIPIRIFFVLYSYFLLWAGIDIPGYFIGENPTSLNLINGYKYMNVIKLDSCSIIINAYASLLVIYILIPVCFIAFPMLKSNKGTTMVNTMIYVGFSCFIIYYYDLISYISAQNVIHALGILIEYLALLIILYLIALLRKMS